MIKHIFLPILLLVCMGCTPNLTRQMQDFMGKKISFDVKFTDTSDMFDAQSRIKSDSIIKFVVLYDSTECSSCRVNRLEQYNDISDLTDRYGVRVSPIIIFSPATAQMSELKRELRLQKLSFPIYIDSDHTFERINPCIPVDRRLHAFLLNRDNEVVLIGDPINNPALWDLYAKTINEL